MLLFVDNHHKTETGTLFRNLREAALELYSLCGVKKSPHFLYAITSTMSPDTGENKIISMIADLVSCTRYNEAIVKEADEKFTLDNAAHEKHETKSYWKNFVDYFTPDFGRKNVSSEVSNIPKNHAVENDNTKRKPKTNADLQFPFSSPENDQWLESVLTNIRQTKYMFRLQKNYKAPSSYKQICDGEDTPLSAEVQAEASDIFRTIFNKLTPMEYCDAQCCISDTRFGVKSGVKYLCVYCRELLHYSHSEIGISIQRKSNRKPDYFLCDSCRSQYAL